MKQIRMRLVSLVESHDEKECSGCPVCTEIQELRNQLKRDPLKQYKKILDKGQDMTKSDITFLIEHGVLKSDIRKAMKMDSTEFFGMLKNLGLVKNRKKC